MRQLFLTDMVQSYILKEALTSVSHRRDGNFIKGPPSLNVFEPPLPILQSIASNLAQPTLHFRPPKRLGDFPLGITVDWKKRGSLNHMLSLERVCEMHA
jgi:hypothetical protein